MARTVERFGGLDCLVNNAGTATAGPLAEASDDDIDTVIDINVKGVLYLCRAAIPHLAKSDAPGGGSIVNTSSVSGTGGDWTMPIYNASKGAVTNLTRGLALQLGAQLGGDVPGGQRPEAGRDAVRRRGGRGELLDDGAAPLDRGDGVVAEHIGHRLRGGRMVHIACVVTRDQEARVEDDHRVTSPTVEDRVHLFAESYRPFRIRLLGKIQQTGPLRSRVGLREVGVDRLVDHLAHRLATQCRAGRETAIGCLIQIPDRGVHGTSVTHVTHRCIE